jgi:transposase
MNAPKLKPLAFELSELQAILEQARSTPLSEEQHYTLQAVVETLACPTQELEKKRISIGRLRNLLFGPRTEKA